MVKPEEERKEVIEMHRYLNGVFLCIILFSILVVRQSFVASSEKNDTVALLDCMMSLILFRKSISSAILLVSAHRGGSVHECRVVKSVGNYVLLETLDKGITIDYWYWIRVPYTICKDMCGDRTDINVKLILCTFGRKQLYYHCEYVKIDKED